MPWQNPAGYPFNLSTIAKNAPMRPGVYGLFNSEGWIYINEATDLKSSLIDCVKQNDRYFPEKSPEGFVFEVLPRSECPPRRNELILECTPIFLPRAQ